MPTVHASPKLVRTDHVAVRSVVLMRCLAVGDDATDSAGSVLDPESLRLL